MSSINRCVYLFLLACAADHCVWMRNADAKIVSVGEERVYVKKMLCAKNMNILHQERGSCAALVFSFRGVSFYLILGREMETIR